MNTPTPRTDDSETRVRKNGFSSLIEYCYANDMAKLETELTAVTKQRDNAFKMAASDCDLAHELAIRLATVTEQRERLAEALLELRDNESLSLGGAAYKIVEQALQYEMVEQSLQSLTTNEL
jgi:hypothetical protein